jgi:type VI protein secretion system component Hcp
MEETMRGMQRIIGGSVVVWCFVAVGAQDAFAQVQSFMFVPGIPGSSVDDRHVNWIDLESVTQQVEAKGTRTLCEIRVFKGLDVAGPALWAAAVTGQTFPAEVRIETVRENTRQRFYEARLVNARVFTLSSTINAFPGEWVVLKAEAVTLTLWPQRPDGSLGPPVAATASCR